MGCSISSQNQIAIDQINQISELEKSYDKTTTSKTFTLSPKNNQIQRIQG